MKIAIDLRPLQTSTKNRGIGYYISNMVESLLAQDDHNLYYLCFMKSGTPIEFKGSERCFLAPLELSPSSTRDEAAAAIAKIIQAEDIDIFVNTSPFEWDVKLPYRYPCRSIAIVYDLIPALFYNHYLKNFPKERQAEYFCDLASLRNYDGLLAISECTKKDLAKLLDIHESRVNIIFAGVNERFHPLADLDPEPVKQKYDIRQDFFICTGGFDYRKNLEKLIEAFGLFCKKNDNVSLVIVCKLLDEQVAYLERKAREFDVPGGRLILTNFVPDDELVRLYNASIGVVFPSIYEGFGLPVLEGMACGKPVITSDTSSMPEVCKDAGILIDPHDGEDICEAMLRLASDPELRKTLGDRCLSIALETGWDKVAAKALSSMEGLYERMAAPGRIRSGQQKKFRLAYFSPMAPKKSGISDYSHDLIPYLLDYADIDLFLDGYDPDPHFSSRCGAYDYRSFGSRAGEYDMIVYQMGNSSMYHEYMYSIIEKYPGLVVLHDYSLHGFIYSITASRGEKNRYIEEMRFSHGKEGELQALKNIKTAFTEDIYDTRFPVNRRVMYNSKGVIVHNLWARDMTALYSGGTPVEMIPHGTNISEAPSKENRDTLRSSLGIDKDDVVFASFGYVALTKRIEKSLEAFVMLAREHKNVKYFLVGEVTDALKEPIKKIIRENDLLDRVIITGYVDDDTFHRYIAAMDVGVNLRYPISGESSGTLVKFIGAGKPVIVSDIGPFREFPDEFCLKVSVGRTEVKEIYEYMKGLVLDENGRTLMGRAAMKYAQEHLSYANAAERYIRFISLIKG